MDFLNFNSVETLPGYEARATFTVNSSSVFKKEIDIVPTTFSSPIEEGDCVKNGEASFYKREGTKKHWFSFRKEGICIGNGNSGLGVNGGDS